MKKKTWLQRIISIILSIILTSLIFLGFNSENEIIQLIIKIFLGTGCAITLSLTINLVIKSIKISISKRVNKQSKNTVQVHGVVLNNVDNVNNNGIIANNITYHSESKKEINETEKEKCEFIIKNMDDLLKFMHNILNDPLNNYSGITKNPDGTINKGDYENLYALYDFFNTPSTIFNNDNLTNVKNKLCSAVVELYFDLSRYTHSYGKEGKKVKDMWSLYYLINEHPLIYIHEEKMGDITQDVEKKAIDELHKLEQDQSNLENAYDNFLEVYNSLI